jgi:uncharacterized lipoprotein NlpE involved in copper resistance
MGRKKSGVKILAIVVICLALAGCANAQLKKGGLYVNQNTCVGMDDLGVAKINNKF